MNSKIVDILTKILEGIGKGYTIDEMNQYFLKKKKYYKQTLSIAFSLLFDKITFEKNKSEYDNNKKSIRFLTEEEKEILGIDNYNYILHLYNVGLISTDTMDEILEQVFLYPENNITKNDINWLVLFSIVDNHMIVPPGSRVLLFTSDSVN